MPENRRSFLARSSAACAGVLLPFAAGALASDRKQENEKDEPDQDISPAEDLMREHGALNRILLIYDDYRRKLAGNEGFDPEPLHQSATIVRHFVEEYHEKLEETYLFPRFQKAGKLVDLVSVLLQQHQAGRVLTSQIESLAVTATIKDSTARQRLKDALHAFTRMYRPHEAREDTVLFPAFRKLVSPHEYASLGEDFEKKEDEMFGEEGFFKVVDQIAGVEKKLGLYELPQFTPSVTAGTGSGHTSL
jgi:hemerythrin-like domain-containing protein